MSNEVEVATEKVKFFMHNFEQDVMFTLEAFVPDNIKWQDFVAKLIDPMNTSAIAKEHEDSAYLLISPYAKGASKDKLRAYLEETNTFNYYYNS